MIGGEAEAVESAMLVFEAMGKTLVHVGSAGAGHAVKALNNYVSASGLLAVCEALTAAEKFGIDPHIANKVFSASTGKNNTTDNKVEQFMLNGAFNSGFSLSLMRKDLDTALAFIQAVGTPLMFFAPRHPHRLARGQERRNQSCGAARRSHRDVRLRA